MISEKELRHEVKRYPAFIAKALKEKDYDEALRLSIELETLQFVLES